MVRNREEAAQAAEAAKTNVPGTCQATVRKFFAANSVGDWDGDDSSDAEDGWKSEPPNHKFTDRNPPRGTPGSFLGGSNDNGHRTIAVGPNGLQRSTDFNGLTKRYDAGVMGNGTIEEIERAMGVTWVGWSDTISAQPIPLPPAPEPPKPKQTQLNKGRQYLKRARNRARLHGKFKRAAKIQKALDLLPKK